jgi:hypothetical protein
MIHIRGVQTDDFSLWMPDRAGKLRARLAISLLSPDYPSPLADP